MSEDLEARIKALEDWKQTLERKEFGINPSRAKAESEEKVVEYCKSLGLQESDGTFFWCRWESAGDGGWYNAGKKIRDWKMVVRQWKAAGWCPSQKNGFRGPNNGNGHRTRYVIEQDIKGAKAQRDKLMACRSYEGMAREYPDRVPQYQQLTQKIQQLNQELGGA